MRHVTRTPRIALPLIFSTCVFFCAGTGTANAQEANDKAAAEVLFEQGRSLLLEGKVGEACPKLAESLRLDRGIGTMLFLAECWQRLGKTASAWAQFREAEIIAGQEKDAREKVAHERAERLAPTLSTLVITLPRESATPGLTVLRDGHPVGEAVFGTKTPIDPGPHVISASASGYKSWETKITVGANADEAKIVVPSLERLPAAPPPKGETPPSSSWPFQRTLGLGLAGVGLVGVGIGTAFGLSAIDKNNFADEHCPEIGCDRDGIAAGERAVEHGTISTIGFIAGGALIVGGAVLFFTASSGTNAKAGARVRGAGFVF
jgi:hypothetical protein